jgi:hypothetical protein
MDMIDYTDFITLVWEDFQRRVEAVQMVGGISVLEVAEGATIPAGWKLDVAADYYVPPDFMVTTTVQ